MSGAVVARMTPEAREARYRELVDMAAMALVRMMCRQNGIDPDKAERTIREARARRDGKEVRDGDR